MRSARPSRGSIPTSIATWGEPEVATLLADPGIVRHRGKIEATIDGARAFQRIEAARRISTFLWQLPRRHTAADPRRQPWRKFPPKPDLSRRISKDLKAEGFRFCGPTIVYAFMQACGLVNDHLVTCPAHARLAGPAALITPPSSAAMTAFASALSQAASPISRATS